jgi:hypothetical protein
LAFSIFPFFFFYSFRFYAFIGPADWFWLISTSNLLYIYQLIMSDLCMGTFVGIRLCETWRNE